MSIKVKFQNANTGTATLNINGLGAKAIKKSNGNDLPSGNIKAGQILHLVYTGSVFQLLGEGGEYGTAQPEHVLEGYTIGTEEGVKSGTMPNRGAVSHTITTQGGSYTIPAGYHSGSGKVTANFANLVASNIKKGVNIGGVVGTLDTHFRQVYQGEPGFRFLEVAYGNGVFVAVGGQGTDYKQVYRSTNGTTWSLVKELPYSADYLIFTGVNFVIVSTQDYHYSSNGSSWTRVTSNPAYHNSGGIAHNGNGTIIVKGYNAWSNDERFYRSTDHGVSWTEIIRTDGSYGSVIGAIGSYWFYLRGSNGNATIYYSTSGTSSFSSLELTGTTSSSSTVGGAINTSRNRMLVKAGGYYYLSSNGRTGWTQYTYPGGTSSTIRVVGDDFIINNTYIIRHGSTTCERLPLISYGTSAAIGNGLICAVDGSAYIYLKNA